MHSYVWCGYSYLCWLCLYSTTWSPQKSIYNSLSRILFEVKTWIKTQKQKMISCSETQRLLASLGCQNDWNSKRDVQPLTISISHQWSVISFEGLKFKTRFWNGKTDELQSRERQKNINCNKKTQTFIFSQGSLNLFSIRLSCPGHSKQFILNQYSLEGFTLQSGQDFGWNWAWAVKHAP